MLLGAPSCCPGGYGEQTNWHAVKVVQVLGGCRVCRPAALGGQQLVRVLADVAIRPPSLIVSLEEAVLLGFSTGSPLSGSNES